MTLVRQRRYPNLCLSLPIPLECNPHFPFPSSTSTWATTKLSTTGDAMVIDDLEKLNVLGYGNGGIVYKVRHRTTFATYALKIIRNDFSSCALSEISILSHAVECPYVVRLHGFFENPAGGEVAILMEYMEGGTLETVGRLCEERLAVVARDLLKGLAYLHARNITHRDIKPGNILVDSKGKVKISDFGVSSMFEACDSYVGTCAYMSPERFNPYGNGSRNYNGFAADIWSFGLTLFELYVGHYPFLRAGEKPSWATLMCAICFDDPPTLPHTASPHFRTFIDCCLRKDSDQRWTATQLLNHPFLCQHSKTH